MVQTENRFTAKGNVMSGNDSKLIKLNADFVRDGKVITRHRILVVETRDLIRGVADAYAQLRLEHPEMPAWDVELSLHRSN